MKLIFGFFILLFISFFAHAQSMQGTYYQDHGQGKTSPYRLLKIHYISPQNIRFYIDISTGAPAYNTGALYGRLKLNKKDGSYEYLPVKDGDCKLTFIKKGNAITVKTISGDCGFGHDVYADGLYYLTDAKNPAYFSNRTGKKIFFDKTAPENFREDLQ